MPPQTTLAVSLTLMSPPLPSTLLTGWVARSFQLGSAALNASQPEPWGSGIGATGVDTGVLGVAGSAGGSAYALMANGTDATIAAIPAVAPNALLARVFNFGSFVRSHRMVRAANAHSKVVPTTQLRYRHTDLRLPHVQAEYCGDETQAARQVE